MQFGPSDVTPALLKKLRVLECANGWYSKSSSSSNKNAAKEYVLIWCKAVNEMRVAEHNAMFQGLLSQASKTSDGANAASSASNDDADDGDAPEADGASDCKGGGDADDGDALEAEDADDGDDPDEADVSAADA